MAEKIYVWQIWNGSAFYVFVCVLYPIVPFGDVFKKYGSGADIDDAELLCYFPLFFPVPVKEYLQAAGGKPEISAHD